MPTLAIIDDRRKIRETLARNIGTELPKNWSVVQRDPLPSMSDYPSWIAENEVAAIILDERLQEEIAGRKIYGDYTGHELAKYIRKRLPNLPIFMVTTYLTDAPLQEPDTEKVFEGIFAREDFYNRSTIYIERIVRSAQRFFDTYQTELAELGEYSSKIASGSGSKKDKKHLLALQTKINGVFASVAVTTENATQLAELEAAVKQLEKATKKAKQLVRKGKRSQ